MMVQVLVLKNYFCTKKVKLYIFVFFVQKLYNNKMNTIDKIIKIYNRSQLSISKFASIVGKDRRTVTSWIDRLAQKKPGFDVLEKISKFFRYPEQIWDENIQRDEFLELISSIPKEEIKIIDEGYVGGLKYILQHEDKERFVIHPQFPGPMYRDTTVPRVYRTQTNSNTEMFKKERIKKMLSYSFETTEWYSIKSLLNFCFSQIGNFYTKEQKIQILNLMFDNFHENYNKHLYLFDSFSRKIYGFDTIYISINIKNAVMFFKSPLDSVFIEVRNKKLIERIHRHFTYGHEAPTHVNPNDATQILKILKNAIESDFDLCKTYEKINKQTPYGGLFHNNISISLQNKLSQPRDGQKIN